MVLFNYILLFFFSRHAIRRLDRLDVAVKETIRPAAIRNREIMLLDKLWHRNIINLLDIIRFVEDEEDRRDGEKEQQHHDQQKLNPNHFFLLVLDWAPISLASLIQSSQQGIPFNPAQFKAVAWQLAEALAYIHENGIIHCNISPKKVLITRKGVVKLADFALAILVSGNNPKYDTGDLAAPAAGSSLGSKSSNSGCSTNNNSYNINTTTTGIVGAGGKSVETPQGRVSKSSSNNNIRGSSNNPVTSLSTHRASNENINYCKEQSPSPDKCTLWYTAPEILIGKGEEYEADNYGYESDCWAYGCLLMELVIGEPLFQGNSILGQLGLINNFFKLQAIGNVENVGQNSANTGKNTKNESNKSSSGRNRGDMSSISSSTSVKSVNSSNGSGGNNNSSSTYANNNSKRLRLVDVRDPSPFNKSYVQQHLEKIKAKHASYDTNTNNFSSISSFSSSSSPANTTTNTSFNPDSNSPLSIKSPTINDHNFIALLEGLLTYDQNERLLAKDVIQHGIFYKLPYPSSNSEIIAGIGSR